MKPFFAALGMTLALAAFAAGIADIPWNKSNVETLRTLDKPAVVRLLSDLWDDNHPFSVPKASEIGEFTWADLTGDGRYQLVMALDVNGRAFFNALVIYWRDSSGKVTTQELDGWMIRNLRAVIRDLNGDGQDELIVPTVLVQYNTAETTTWPMVYRLEKGKYVEASRDFPAFYDDEVLPRLDEQIKFQAKTAAGPRDQEMLAVPIMERDKILRVIGRDPTAGLRQAYQWMNTDDPYLLQDAAATFQDIGGHRAELRAAAEAQDHALCERNPGMAMCKKAPERAAQHQ